MGLLEDLHERGNADRNFDLPVQSTNLGGSPIHRRGLFLLQKFRWAGRVSPLPVRIGLTYHHLFPGSLADLGRNSVRHELCGVLHRRDPRGSQDTWISA
jgi:hypothetical protein